MSSIIFLFIKKKTFKVALQYLFNVFILSNTVFNLKLLKLDSKMRILKNLEEIWKTWKKFEKKKWQPLSVMVII